MSRSFFVGCTSDEEQERLFGERPGWRQCAYAADDYRFSKRFGWIADRFGVSWQPNLAGRTSPPLERR